MKLLITGALLLTTFTSMAHDDCNVNLNGGIKLDQTTITFSKNDKPLYSILNDEDLLVGNNRIELTPSQQSLVTQYSSSIRSTVPEVKEIAIDAIDLAIDGVNLAFNELLGEGNDISEDLTYELTNIRNEVEVNFSQEKGFSIDENGFEGDELFGEDFEQRIETVVEKAVENSMGSLMIAIGQELLFSGGDMDALETRMETFGEQMENEMESRGALLEKKGEALCQSVKAIDDLEEQLRIEIDELSDFNIIAVDNNHSKSI